MGYSSQTGHVIFKTQATPGVLDPDLGSEGIAMRLRSGSLGTNRELMIPDAEIGGNRDIADAYMGTISNSGEYEFYARFEALPTLLNAALGSNDSVAGVGFSTHTITPSDAAQLPFLSIEEKISSTFDAFTYYDAVVNTLHLEVDPSGYLMGTIGIIAASRAIGITPTADPTWDESPLIVGTNCTMTYNSVDMLAKSWSIDINNNFEDDDFRLGSFYLKDLTPKRREITTSINVREVSKDLWRQSTLGSAGATVPSGLSAKCPMVFTANSYESIGATAQKSQLVVTIPKLILKPYNVSPSGDDLIESTIEGQAVRPVAATPIMTAVIKNELDAVV